MHTAILCNTNTFADISAAYPLFQLGTILHQFIPLVIYAKNMKFK